MWSILYGDTKTGNPCKVVAYHTEVASPKTSKVASAITSLLHLEEGDHTSLLQYYFIHPLAITSCDPDGDNEADVTGAIKWPNHKTIANDSNNTLPWLVESLKEKSDKNEIKEGEFVDADE